MTEFLSSSSFFAIALTLLIWRFATALQRKVKSPLLHPILVSTLTVILVLMLFKIPNVAYQENMKPFSFLMTPATVCLAVPLYEQAKVLRRNLPAIMIGVLCGTLTSLLCVFILCVLFGLDAAMTVSLLPKSVTTAIGVPISESMGGFSSITVTAIISSGILGNIFAPYFYKLLKIQDPVAQGAAMGTAAHVIGTTKANEIGSVQGAVSSLALVIAGIMTAFLVPLMNSLFM
ncbi:MAG: LrgB family protein [Clostridia bacterium]|nr:LrgB family protein [Clostridia bacterium]